MSMNQTWSMLWLITAIVTVIVSCSRQDPDDKLVPRKDIILTRSEMEYVEEGNQLAFKFFNEVYSHRDFIISPFSLQRCLGMVQNGAQGKTREEIAAVIGYGEADNAAINSFLQSYTSQLQVVDPSTSFELADALLVGSWFPVKGDFRDRVSSCYDAEVINLDFWNSEQSKVFINDWVKTATNGMISSLIDEVDPLTVSMVLNAFAFKGKWTSVFDPDYTAKDYSFQRFDGGTSRVDMMYQKGSFEYASDDEYQLLCLPYGNGAFQMVILLPRSVDGDFSSVRMEQWEGLLMKAEKEEIPVMIPRFSIATSLDLDDPLSEMGMPVAFTSEADFSLIAGVPGDILLKKTRQACFIEVDESGTKAAAATVIPAAFDGSPLPSLQFLADHPFLFAIIEKSTQGILLIGQFCGE